MRKTRLGSVLVAISVACVGCSSEDGGAGGPGGGGGTGGTGGTGSQVTALSFDAETALPASAGAAVAVAFGTQFGALMSSLGVFGGLTPRSAQGVVSPKDTFPLPEFCRDGGSASLDWSGALVAGETVIVTLQNCDGSPFLSGPTNGTIRFDVDRAEGLVFTGTATLDLASPDAVIAGGFSVRTNVANLFLGCGLGTVPDCEPATENVAATQGGQQLSLECFEIYQRYPEFFRPLAVATLGDEVYTINDYQSTPDNISFRPDGVPVRGTVRLVSGVGPGAGGTEMPCFNGMPQGDNSYCDLTFNADGCVDINCMADDGTSIVRSAFWDDLLDFDFVGASQEPCGAGGAGGTAGNAPL